jgi:hypothetical protein
MHNIQILEQHPNRVLENFKVGEIERMELAVEQITDEFMIYGLRGGLIDALSKSFPDPRKECEITVKQILSAGDGVKPGIPLRHHYNSSTRFSFPTIGFSQSDA